MDSEEQPLLGNNIRHIEPVPDEENFIIRYPGGQRELWQRTKRVASSLLTWLLYPILWISLWVILSVKNFEGVLYRSPCKVCRKKSGTVDQLLAASSDGCQYCELYTEVLSYMAPQIRPELGIFTIKSESHLTKFPLELRIWNAGTFETAWLRFMTPRVCKEWMSKYPRSFNVPRDSASDESMKFAEDSVKECVKRHKDCRKRGKPPLPRRVIDVCSFDFASDVRLYQSGGKRAAYIALSHSWGHKHTFMTTKSNLEERLRGIRLHDLPKTFKDAVFMARKLKIQYLWIDSLCIIQDNHADWERESPKMGAVYGDAYLTIAAGSALNDQTGFLGLRSEFMYKDFILGAKVARGVPITRVQDLTAPTRRDPLSFRAWAFQERLLSRRTLYYHQQELVFECKQGLRCECMSCTRMAKKLRREESGFWERSGVKFAASSFPRAEIPTSTNVKDIHGFWRQFIVPEYSARSISRDLDRLPALSSVVSLLQSLSGDTYLAGMWKLALPADLTWKTVQNARSRTGERSLATIPSEYVAPSWCWTSIHGQVEHSEADGTNGITYRASLLHAECTVFGSNQFGQVTSGSICLNGTVIYGIGELHAGLDKLWPYRIKLLFPTPRQMTIGFEPDVAFLAQDKISHPEIFGRENIPESWLRMDTTLRRERLPIDAAGYTHENGHAQDETDDRLPSGRVRCLLMCSRVRKGRCEWVFLVLGHSILHTGLYERLGLLTCWINGDDKWTELDAVRPEAITII